MPNTKPKTKARIVVLCPGRGSYNKEELGTLARASKNPSVAAFVRSVDLYRESKGLETVSALDARSAYSGAVHTSGENASVLIYACAVADYLSLDPERFEVVAITGNSMGWYLALACGQALSTENATHLVQTMGSLGVGPYGGQVITPVVGEDWRPDPARERAAQEIVTRLQQELASESPGEILSPSIRLGGYRVWGGTDRALAELVKRLPKEQERYPMKLINHAAFHTAVMRPVSERAQELLGPELFQAPRLPLIDGRGKIWQPHSTSPQELREYTLQTQVTETYDFSKAVEVALKEFAPDQLLLLGPGASLGGALGQILVELKWKGVTTKAEFQAQQAGTEPFLLTSVTR